MAVELDALLLSILGWRRPPSYAPSNKP